MTNFVKGGTVLAAAVFAFGFGNDCGGAEESPEEGVRASRKRREGVEVEVLAAGKGWEDRGKAAAGLEVIESSKALQLALDSVGHSGGPFDIDFSEAVVLGVHAGQQAHDGVSFHCYDAVDVGDRIYVRCSLVDPLAGGDALTYPYVFLKAPRSEKPYELHTRTLRMREAGQADSR